MLGRIIIVFVVMALTYMPFSASADQETFKKAIFAIGAAHVIFEECDSEEGIRKAKLSRHILREYGALEVAKLIDDGYSTAKTYRSKLDVSCSEVDQFIEDIDKINAILVTM